MPKVYNKYHRNAPPSAIYIGRGSAFGNPFLIGRDGNRDEVCDKYEEYVHTHDSLKQRIKKELQGKDLVCYCAPKRCHGDFLIKIANED